MELKKMILTHDSADTVTGTIFNDNNEFDDVMSAWQLRINQKTEKSPLFTWREFISDVIGLLNSKDIFFDKLSDELKYNNVLFKLGKVDLFDSGYVYKDRDGFFSDDIPFMCRDIFNLNDVVHLRFDTELEQHHCIKWNSGEIESTEIMDTRGVTLNFTLKLNITEPITKYNDLYFYITGFELELHNQY